MSFVENKKSLTGLKSDYDVFLANMQKIIKEVRPRSDITRTKLALYKKNLDNINELPDHDRVKLVEIINKLIAINILFKNGSNIKYRKSDLYEIIEGAFCLDDKNQKYNDKFLEFSMALRFSQSLDKDISIDLKTDCDIIIADTLAIECKYLHSDKKIIENIEYAMRQIDNRIDAGLATHGIVALDFSNVINHEELKTFAYYIYDNFHSGHIRLEKNTNKITKSIIHDRNFSGILGMYISHKVEVELYDKIVNSSILEKMNTSTKAIVMQASTSIAFPNENNMIPVPMRTMPFYINPKLSESESNHFSRLIKSLATGI